LYYINQRPNKIGSYYKDGYSRIN